ncbi:hypothetical protein EV361DRAFT_505491 [Lentinula raphanica]|nr:hypothetical protein EV361DRAFT_505491 [Lentinula raphanica]
MPKPRSENANAMTFGYIDDQDGDPLTGVFPVLSPPSDWTQGSICTECAFHPDPSKAFNGTWSDTTHYVSDPARTVQFNFTGTSLDVYCIIPNPSNQDLISTYNLTFSLDGQPLPQTFSHRSDLSDNFTYNSSVLSLEGLSLTNHVFTMLAASTTVNSSLLFDYARYSNITSSSTAPLQTQTSSVTSPTTGHHVSTLPIIIGVVLGSIILILLHVIFVPLYRRRKQLRPRSIPKLNGIEPYVYQVEPSHSSPRSLAGSTQSSGQNFEQSGPDLSEPPSYSKVSSS